MKKILFELFRKQIFFLIVLTATISYKQDLLNAEETYLLKDMQINSSTKVDEKNSKLPTNPFEIVEMIRRATSLNEATNPTDAIDDAIESFNMIDDTEKL